MNCLGVILARGGSKRCPGKNMRELGGIPLIGWTMTAAAGSLSLDRIVVSSDNDDILRYAASKGMDTINRPPQMATDEASSYPAMLHALDWTGYPFDLLCLLQPTSPFRHPIDIEACVGLAKDCVESPTCAAGGVVSVTSGASVPNGAIYVGRTDWLRDGGDFDGPAVIKYAMPHTRSIDIDTENDFAEAEAMV